MKKLFITTLAMLLPMLAIGQVLCERDFTGITEFTDWSMFADGQEGSVTPNPDGLAITVGTQTGQLCQPQVMVVPDGCFNLEKNGNYRVIIIAKFPCNGTLRINMGTWADNDQADFPITATGEFQTVECDFENWSVNVTEAHLLYGCGDFKGTTIIKKILVIDKGLGGTGSDICYNFIPKGKIAEVVPHTNGMYYGAVEIPATVMHEGEEYTVKTISAGAFSDCSALYSITIPSSVTCIGDGAFSYCNSLTSVEIPNSVTNIERSAFSYCSGLKSLIIPQSVTSLGNYALSNCSNLTSVEISNSLNTISFGTFEGCSSLTSIIIPSSVCSIGGSAFSGCSNLTSIIIPNSVTTIEWYAFSNCSGLNSITIPNNVNYIDRWAFERCSNVTTIYIGSGVNFIGNQAFAQCTQLTDLYCIAENVPSTYTSAFDGSYINYATLHVPASALNTYKTTNPWSGFGEFVTISGEVIPKCATPTIIFENGKIRFSCETEGVQFAPEFSTNDSGELSVKVYATKSGYENSDIATKQFTATGLFGDLNNDGTVNVADHVELTKIIMNEE